MLADEATGLARRPGGCARPLSDQRERGRRQWREAGLRSVAYYRRDRPDRDGDSVVREHPAEGAEPALSDGALQSSRQRTCQ